MGLCLADSLLSSAARAMAEGSRIIGNFDGSDLRNRFHAWWYHGYNNAFTYADHRGDWGKH